MDPKESLFAADDIYRWVEQQAALGPRRPGSPAGLKNEDFLFSLLQSFGVQNVRREPVPVTFWDLKKVSLSIADKSVEAFAIPHAAFTSDEGVQAPMLYADSSRLFDTQDWRGCIVVTELHFPMLNAEFLQKVALGSYDPRGELQPDDRYATWIRVGWHIYTWAAKRGARGFIGIIKDQPGGTCRMYAPYGFKEKDILDKPIPGVWVSKGDAEFVIQKAREGATAHLTVTGTRAPALTHNIVGDIPGTRDDEVIVLSCHHDSPFTSPVEDGTGVAVVLALARYFALAKKLKRRVTVLLTSGHFYGSIGTRTYIEQHRKDVVARTALEISIEHVALEAREDSSSGKLVATGESEPAGIFVPFNRRVCDIVLNALKVNAPGRALLLPPEGPLGDYPPTDGGDWYAAGVPVINYISNPAYLLTDDDALQWVDKTGLTSVAKMFADIIEKLDSVPSKHLRKVDFPVRKGLMRALKHVVRAKSTALGLKPLH